MKQETINLLIRPKDSTQHLPTPTHGYRVGKVLFVHKEPKYSKRWDISSINGMHVDYMTFRTRKIALEIAEYLAPFAEAATDDQGNLNNNDLAAFNAFKTAVRSKFGDRNR